MSTKQMALDALKLAVLQNGCDMIMTGEELRKCESAIVALEADIAQPVEPVAWAWEVLPDSPIQKHRGAKSGVYLDNPSELGIDINGKESTSNYKWTLLYTTPPEPAVNAELLEALDDLPASGWTTDINGAPVDALVAKWRVLEIAKATS